MPTRYNAMIYIYDPCASKVQSVMGSIAILRRWPLHAQLLLEILDSVPLGSGRGSVLGLHLGALLAQALIHSLFGIIAASGGLVEEALGVALFEGGDHL